jgi:hypothetical protein
MRFIHNTKKLFLNYILPTRTRLSLFFCLSDFSKILAAISIAFSSSPSSATTTLSPYLATAVNFAYGAYGCVSTPSMSLIQICRISRPFYSGIRKYRSRPLAWAPHVIFPPPQPNSQIITSTLCVPSGSNKSLRVSSEPCD